VPLEPVWRPKRYPLLSKKQKEEKQKRDTEYEIAVQNLYTDKTRTSEQKQAKKKVLWDAYYQWAVTNGLYEEVTPEQQLTEAEGGLNAQLEEVNLIRTELKKSLVEVKEKMVK